MAPAKLATATRAAILVFATVLYIISLVVLVKRVHSFKAIGEWLPGTWERYYEWRESPHDEKWIYYYIEYDYTIDNLTWVATGISIVAASLMLAVEITAVIRQWGKSLQSPPKRHGAVTYGLGLFAVGAFIMSIVTTVYTNTRIEELWDRCQYTGLNWPGSPDTAPDSKHICTHEMIACDIGPNHLDFSSNPSSLCNDERVSRNMVPAIAVFAGLMTIAWAVQIWVAKKQTPVYDADERVRRLEEEEEA